MRRWLPLWIVPLAALYAAAAQAAVLTLDGTSLSVSIGALPTLSLPINAPTPVFVSSGSGSFTEPAGVFGPGTVSWRRGLTTGIPVISGITAIGFGNGTKSVNGAAGTAMGGLTGTLIINVLQLLNLNIPLSVVGVPGATNRSELAGIAITVVGQGWTTGAATIMGITTTTPGGAAVNTATLAGSDARTPGHRGSLSLVSGFRAVTNVAGNLPGFAVQSLHFIPEPGLLLLCGAGALGLLLCGRKRMRR